MPRYSKKSIGLPLTQRLSAIQLEEIQHHFELYRTALEDMHRHVFNDLTNLDGAFANIHVHDSTASAQTIPTGAGYTLCDGFADNGESKNCIADAANNKITITKVGYYLVSHNSSFIGSKTGVKYYVAAFLDGSEVDALHFARKVSNQDVGAASFAGILKVEDINVDIDIRVRHDDLGSVDYTMEYANLVVNRIGDI